MGGNLVILLPFPLAALAFGWKQIDRLQRFGLIAAATLMTGVLILTKSRGAWMAFGGILAVLSLLRWRRGWILLLAILTAGLVSIPLFGLSNLMEALTANDALGGLDGRLEIWSRAVYLIRDYPVTGIGMGTFVNVVDGQYPFFRFLPGQIVHAHNLFLQVAVDLGLLGLIAWLGILIGVITISWKIYRQGFTSQESSVTGLGVGLLCSHLALSIHGLTDAVTWGMVRTAPLVWGLWGVTVAIWFVYSPVYNVEGKAQLFTPISISGSKASD
jgi:putative inorganic carbon (HCO3(-)) transporter